ncbi:MAG: TlpA disulfide reductase family protein [Vicinamibacterales bacterium]
MTRTLCASLLALGIATTAYAQSTPAPAAAKPPSVIAQVREAIGKDDFAGGEKILHDYQAAKGWTPEALEAYSWLGRGALAAKRLDAAEKYARETQKLCLDALATRELDAEANLPIALGAAIEVQAHVNAERGARTEAVHTLQQELDRYKGTSIRTRIQKNINLLSLEGKPAPAYEVAETLGGRPVPSLAQLKGRPAVLFFWAHWCPDCKAMAQAIGKLQEQYAAKGLAVIGPTQRYGYVAARAKAGAAEEMAYIDDVRQKSYNAIADFPVPVGEETFKIYGCSTTPTVVLVDRQGIVQLYHPGQMKYEELEPKVRAIVESQATSQQ